MLNRRKKRLLRSPDISPRAIYWEEYSQPGSRGKTLTLRRRFMLFVCFTAIFVLSAAMLIRHYAPSEEATLKKLAVVAASNA